jgi:2-keto-4-pentenoate hydratase/2-oxohepta-3-ene-1,7-dioic acid hydratase in catechol pathway
VSFYSQGALRERALHTGVLDGDEIAVVERDGQHLDARSLLMMGQNRDSVLRQALTSGRRLPFDASKLAAPIAEPRKFLGIGLNYRSHLEEALARNPSMTRPSHQIWFNKQVSCVTGPFDPIHKPKVSEQLDYEAELAVVIGSRCRHVPTDHAHEVIAGYMVCNDVSVRDWQKRAVTATLGKSFDTHGPTGPWLTIGMSIEEAENLGITTWVNGEVRQQGRTSDLIHGIREMIAELTTVFTLEPGDILATGTPAGVCAGMPKPQFLKEGDVVRIEIERLGAIENRVIAEPLLI